MKNEKCEVVTCLTQLIYFVAMKLRTINLLFSGVTFYSTQPFLIDI